MDESNPARGETNAGGATVELRVTRAHTEPDLWIVEIRGDLEVGSCSALRRWAEERRPPGHLVVDVRGVGFLDSSGLAGLLELWGQARQQGYECVLCGLPRHLLRVLEETGLRWALDLCGSPEEALAGLRELRSEGSGRAIPKGGSHSPDPEAALLQEVPTRSRTGGPVESHNEWDPLEEVIVGRLEGAVVPPAHPSVYSSIPRAAAFWLRFVGGWRYPSFLVNRAQRELDDFIRLLEAEGVTVRRPAIVDGRKVFSAPGWRSRGFCLACPRDCYLVVGDEVIETPSPWRSRYFEAFAYRQLFKGYFRDGARWTAAPRPELPDELYDAGFTPPAPSQPMRYVINEFEPVFDGADFARCGRDLFVTPSNVTNRLGIEWVRRHLGEGYRVHEIETLCRQPMHIDSTFVPLAPGRLMVNPAFVDPARLPRALRSWDVLIPPEPEPAPGWKLSMASPWLSLNVLMLDERRVVVEASQKRLIRQFRDWGFEPLPLEFSHYGAFGGSFHCATLDVRRRGPLQSYCD